MSLEQQGAERLRFSWRFKPHNQRYVPWQQRYQETSTIIWHAPPPIILSDLTGSCWLGCLPKKESSSQVWTRVDEETCVDNPSAALQTKLTANKVDNEQSWRPTKLMTNKVDDEQSWQQTKLAKKHVLTIHKLYRKKKVDNKQSWRWTKLAMNNVDNEQSWQLTKLTTDKEVGEETCVDNSSAVQTKSTRVSSWAQPEMCQPAFFCNTTKLLGRSYLVSKIKPLLKTSLLSMTTISEIWVCGTRTSLPIQTWFVTCLFYLLHYCDTFRANLG